MTRGRIGAAVIHGRADGDTGRHLVVQQAADFASQPRLKLLVQRIIGTAGIRVNGACQVALERVDDLGRLGRVGSDDQQRSVAEGLGLKLLGAGK